MKNYLLFVILLFQNFAHAQVAPSSNESDRLAYPTVVRRYYTQQNHQRLLALDSTMAQRRAFLDMSARTNQGTLDSDVVIPVAVHYIKNYSDYSLPDFRGMANQLLITGKDFRQTAKIMKHPADTAQGFSDVNAMDTKISFCNASVNPGGYQTLGFDIKYTGVNVWQPDDQMKSSATGGVDAWDPERYLNIWVVNLPDSVSGYAQMPGGPAATDGIVIDQRYFGQKPQGTPGFPYTEGKTFTHLVGSYLNLYELWSETVPCGDDGEKFSTERVVVMRQD